MTKRTTIKQEMEITKNSLMQLLLAQDMSLDEKRELVRERNEYLFIFGDNLTAQGNNDYTTYINKLYLGD